MIKMRYVGKASIHGIPARDLTDREVEKHGGAALLESTGLYELVQSGQKMWKTRHEDKALRGAQENKEREPWQA